MSQQMMHLLHRAKFGPKSTSGAAEAIAATVGKSASLLAPGWHTFEPTSECRVLQTNVATWTTPPSAAIVLAKGRRVPANNEVHFFVEHDQSDAYLIWVRVSADGTANISVANTIYRGE